MDNGTPILAIEAVVGGGCAVVVEKNSAEQYTYVTTSSVILAVLIGAFLSDAAVVLETVGTSRSIKRVPAVKAGAGPRKQLGDYQVSRVATQREGDGQDRLEVFLIKNGESDEIQYNVYDHLVQRILMAAFRPPTPANDGIALRVEFDSNKVIIRARIGECW